jgi:uncharacterized lipoprotein
LISGLIEQSTYISEGDLFSYRLVICISLLTLLAACQTLGERKRAQSLQDTLRSYEASIRWQSGRHAAKFQDPQGSVTESRTDHANVRVTGYEVVQGPTMLGDLRAVQAALIQYVMQDSQIVKELTDQQVWLYNEDEETWFLNSPVPEFR